MTTAILFATDLSGCSGPAARLAAEFARRLDARLHVLHVRATSTATPQPALERLAAELGPAGSVVTAVETGPPVADKIVDYAGRHGVELIVVGTHGRTGVSRALLGSVAERVVRTSTCPVLTVPCVWQGAPAAAHPPVVAREPELHRCLVCRGVSEDLICMACREQIRGGMIERKHREERTGHL